jgi:hypothetical protein
MTLDDGDNRVTHDSQVADEVPLPLDPKRIYQPRGD